MSIDNARKFIDTAHRDRNLAEEFVERIAGLPGERAVREVVSVAHEWGFVFSPDDYLDAAMSGGDLLTPEQLAEAGGAALFAAVDALCEWDRL